MDIFVATTILAAILLLVLLLPGSRRGKLPPGPRPWPILGNLPHLGPAPHQTLAAMATNYGPLLGLRLGSVPVVVATSARTAALFLKVHDAKFASRPPNAGSKHIAYNGQDLVFAPYGPRWRALRKICSLHLFSGKALNDFRRVREEEVAALVGSLLRRRADGGDQDVNVVNLSELLNVCTANALGRALMGRRVFEEVGKDAGEFKEMVMEAMVLAGVFNIGDFIPALDWFDLQGVVGKMKRLHRRFDAFLGRIVDEHRARCSHRHEDLLSILMGIQSGHGHGVDNGRWEGGLSDIEIKALLLNLFTAGTDTSSSTVEWAMAELIQHPDILAQLRQELDSVIGHDRLVADADLTQLPLLEAVVKETFRLHPSTPLSVPRVATEDCDVDGYRVPQGTTLLVNIWAIGRDPEVWKDPLEFRPSRFLPGGEAANVDVRGGDFQLIPFGSGRRICAGLSLGLKIVLFVTASLVHAFDWGLPIGQTPERLHMEEDYGLTLRRAAPLRVCPLPRLNPTAYK